MKIYKNMCLLIVLGIPLLCIAEVLTGSVMATPDQVKAYESKMEFEVKNSLGKESIALNKEEAENLSYYLKTTKEIEAKWFKTSLVLGVLLFSLSLGGYLTLRKPD